MKTIKYIVTLAILCGLFFIFTHAGRTIEVANAQKPLLERIADTELKYGIKKDVLKNVIECESRFIHEGRYGDWSSKSQSFLAFGIAQFHRDTFYDMVKLSGMRDLSYIEENDQIELAGWGISHGYQKRWSCYIHKYGNQSPLIPDPSVQIIPASNDFLAMLSNQSVAGITGCV